MRQEQSPVSLFSAFLDLARMRIVVMVLVACAIGFLLAYRGFAFPLRLFPTLLGTALISGGACALNCYLEREADALMPRTCRRPIPAGVISPAGALAFGLGLVLSGSLLLYWQVNLLSSLLGLVAAALYLAVYTPAKRLTWLNTSIGALPGAVPPLIGWASARGQLDPGAWVLFFMLFLWQHTHFFPIAWLLRSDYSLAGFRMLPVLETGGRKTFLFTVLSAIALLPVSLLLYSWRLAGLAYCVGCAILGLLLVVAGFRLLRRPSRGAAHLVLALSLWYLPVILAAVVLDRWLATPVGSHVFATWNLLQ